MRIATLSPPQVATVHNTGPLTFDISGVLRLAGGPGALRAGPFRVELGQALAPGASESASVQLGAALPSGPWRADMVLDSGRVQREAAATITFPPVVAAATPAGTHHVERSAEILLVLLVIFFGVLFFRKRWGRDSLKPGRPLSA